MGVGRGGSLKQRAIGYIMLWGDKREARRSKWGGEKRRKGKKGTGGGTTDMEAYYCRSFRNTYTYVKGISMKSPCHGGENASIRHPMPPSKTTSARSGLHHVELLAKGVPSITNYRPG